GTATVPRPIGFPLPLQVLAPAAREAPAVVVSVLNPTGGLLGGDRLTMEADVGPGARALLTRPSATRVYRASAEATVQTVAVRLGRGAAVEWVPDHTIPFPGSVFRQTIECELEDAATLVLFDAFAAGRVARDEAWAFGRLESALTVRERRGLGLHDRSVTPPGARP